MNAILENGGKKLAFTSIKRAVQYVNKKTTEAWIDIENGQLPGFVYDDLKITDKDGNVKYTMDWNTDAQEWQLVKVA